jgi:hypothetical protein
VNTNTSEIVWRDVVSRLRDLIVEELAVHIVTDADGSFIRGCILQLDRIAQVVYRLLDGYRSGRWRQGLGSGLAAKLITTKPEQLISYQRTTQSKTTLLAMKWSAWKPCRRVLSTPGYRKTWRP